VAAERQKRPIIFIGSQASCLAFKDTCEKNRMTQEVLFVRDGTPQAARASRPWSALEMHAVSQLTPLLDQYAGRIEAVVLYETSRELPSVVAEKLRELHFAGHLHLHAGAFPRGLLAQDSPSPAQPDVAFSGRLSDRARSVFERLKRLSDIVLSLLGLVLSSPLLLLCAAAVLAGGPRPVFYLQMRVGKIAQLPDLQVPRTCVRGAAQGDLYNAPNDHRITRVGPPPARHALRRIPAALERAARDMSLIAPRGMDPTRRALRAGIPATISGTSSSPASPAGRKVNYPYGANLDDTLRKLEYDLYYIRYFSFTPTPHRPEDDSHHALRQDDDVCGPKPAGTAAGCTLRCLPLVCSCLVFACRLAAVQESGGLPPGHPVETQRVRKRVSCAVWRRDSWSTPSMATRARRPIRQPAWLGCST